ncbi:MAG: N-acetylmuramoyl-L-alanine amidase [Spirochaetes bacterium]|nr:N-acetylmuramoyl-L-alanine amidase [Spirochaetota bacterium]
MINKKFIFILVFIILFPFSISCSKFKILNFRIYNLYEYEGDIKPAGHDWLKGKKIFVDPGHGGKGTSDRFRIGPGGITEEEVNLRVGMILGDMLEKAGALVYYSREKDEDIPLRDRVDMVNDFQPDLLISLHHDGSPRPMDNVNHPSVLIWGNRKVNPMSFAFAELLLDEFNKLMDAKGAVISDFSVYKETGTMILRETRYTCPGAIGEAGFFSDEQHAKRLNDIHYNQAEAEAYFIAVSRFIERGLPKAEVLISSQPDNSSYLYNLIKDADPVIALKVNSGLERAGIIKESVNAALDGVPVKCRAAADDLYFIDYGKRLYPGGHSIKFSFKNQRNQSSMIYSAGFTIEIKKGDYDRLISEGIKFLNTKVKQKEGLKMLLSAYSMGLTDPDAGRVIWNIAKGFNLIADKVNSDYYYAKLYHFYPQSKYAKNLEGRFKGYRFPVEYNGKSLKVIFEPDLKDQSRK